MLFSSVCVGIRGRRIKIGIWGCSSREPTPNDTSHAPPMVGFDTNLANFGSALALYFPRNGPREKSRFMHVDAAWKDESDDHKKQRDHRLLLREPETMPRDYDAGAASVSALSPEDWAFEERAVHLGPYRGARAVRRILQLNLFRY
ncbi:hypothetical protein EVAR_48141_1 [Eumeta japonica]|uniref:Uncharacterized protein n=1 Tax=Eumeta variegata TaxID=151549 RepID=A0A4C2A8Q2_EUMVA|nr:hypothetical protein EVAR_48141_1 [Eumeta japonica]